MPNTVEVSRRSLPSPVVRWERVLEKPSLPIGLFLKDAAFFMSLCLKQALQQNSEAGAYTSATR